ncbi:MAG TPA: arginine N-succinyltransferase [Polyangiaceae bacterium]|nr:arginine N-succinyltransferase [Polyangiaceae bacterium]
MTVTYEIRGAVPTDEDQLLEVARHLNTVNLPADRGEIRALLDHAQKSFTGVVKDPRRREFVFVVVDLVKARIVGTSMIVAQLGRRDAPYIYVDVFEEERYSATLDKHFRHVVLKIGYSYNGPTEIGGLIVLPEYRGKPERLGQLISCVRFLYVKMHRDVFRDELLAELLPPLEPDGTSHLWNAVGLKFTEMTYAEADRLSKKNKEFIKGLFPEGAIYVSLLPKDAQDVIGKVGAQTKGVEAMLRRIGFRYAWRVDPFDGGPHFTAPTDDVTLVQRSRKERVTRLLDPAEAGKNRVVVAVESSEAPFFRAVPAKGRPEGAGMAIGQDAAAHLGIHEGDDVWMLPFE